MVTLTHLANDIELPLAGTTVGVAIRAVAEILNLGPGVRTYVGNSFVHCDYVIRQNDHIQFLPLGGRKGLDPFTEEMLTMSQAARRLPCVRGKKHPHPNTVARWATHGQKSKSGKQIYLESICISGTNFTSIEALRRYFDQLNDVETKVPPTYRQSQLDKQAAEAEKILRERGLIK